MSRSSRHSARRRGGFQPPHCPNPQCDFHSPHPHWRFVKNGHHIRLSDGRRIQDYRCRHCGRFFSTPTFRPTYWLRRRDLLPKVATWVIEGPGLRQIARAQETSHTTIARQVARVGRHCLLFHRNLLQNKHLDEPLAVDGFETFEYSHYFPFHINFAVGSDSWLLYHFTDSPLRRKGRMSEQQRQRRAHLENTLGVPDPKAVERGMAALLRPLVKNFPGKKLRLYSDEHPAYPRALRRVRREERDCPIFDHCVTSSTAPRTAQNPLFPVNLADLLARHSSANHRRETIAFSKRRQGALERAAVFTVWRNCIKRRSENGPRKSAAMWAGLLDRLLTWPEVLGRRLFPAHADLPSEWRHYYGRQVKTAVLGARQTVHACRYAF